MTEPGDSIQQFRVHLQEMAGGRDTRGIEIAHDLRVLGKLFELAVARAPEYGELSGPRLGILLRLLREDEKGNKAGINPTRLSHYQSVNKNTITALLKGLEESGWVERNPDPADRRAALVRITPAGRDLVLSTAPLRFEYMNSITSCLDDTERDYLLELLARLRQCLLSYTDPKPPDSSG